MPSCKYCMISPEPAWHTREEDAVKIFYLFFFPGAPDVTEIRSCSKYIFGLEINPHCMLVKKWAQLFLTQREACQKSSSLSVSNRCCIRLASYLTPCRVCLIYLHYTASLLLNCRPARPLFFFLNEHRLFSPKA